MTNTLQNQILTLNNSNDLIASQHFISNINIFDIGSILELSMYNDKYENLRNILTNSITVNCIAQIIMKSYNSMILNIHTPFFFYHSLGKILNTKNENIIHQLCTIIDKKILCICLSTEYLFEINSYQIISNYLDEYMIHEVIDRLLIGDNYLLRLRLKILTYFVTTYINYRDYVLFNIDKIINGIDNFDLSYENMFFTEFIQYFENKELMIRAIKSKWFDYKLFDQVYEICVKQLLINIDEISIELFLEILKIKPLTEINEIIINKCVKYIYNENNSCLKIISNDYLFLFSIINKLLEQITLAPDGFEYNERKNNFNKKIQKN